MLVEKYNKTLVLVTWHSLCNEQGLCKGLVSIRPSVCLSVPSIDLSSDVRRVCCWAPSGQEISIDGGGAGRPTATAPQQQMWAVSRLQSA